MFPTFVCYWQSQFTVLIKFTDIIYKVDYGQRDKPQVIHVDRLRLERVQVLRERLFRD